MDVRNCKKCGKVFAYNGYNTCPQCKKQDEEEFMVVKEYVYDNPGADIQLVSQETGVEVKKILRYLRDGKLEIREGNGNLILDCERCGAAIKTGRFCERCTVEMQRELRSSISPKNTSDKAKSSGDRMFIADRRKK